MKKAVIRRIIAESTKEEQIARSEYYDDYLYEVPIAEDEDLDCEDSCDDYSDDAYDKYYTIKVGPYEMQSPYCEDLLAENNDSQNWDLPPKSRTDPQTIYRH